MSLHGWLWFALVAICISAIAVLILHAIYTRPQPTFRPPIVTAVRRPEGDPFLHPGDS